MKIDFDHFDVSDSENEDQTNNGVSESTPTCDTPTSIIILTGNDTGNETIGK